MDKVKMIIKYLKSEHALTRQRAALKLGEGKVTRAVPDLIKTLTDIDRHVLRNVTRALQRIVNGCGTIEELEKVENGISEGLVVLRKEEPDKTMLINAQIEIAKLTRAIAKRKDELASKRDLLLDDKPKPPKKGRGMYQVSRRIRNR